MAAPLKYTDCKMIRKGSLLLVILLPAVCTRSGIRNSIQDTAKSAPVITGYYPHYHQPLSPDHPLQPQISALRQDIEANENLLRQLVRQRYDVKSPLEFRFSYAGLDSANNRLIIRYFANEVRQIEIAGWQVQLVYRLPRSALESIYVWAVPLE